MPGKLGTIHSGLYIKLDFGRMGLGRENGDLLYSTLYDIKNSKSLSARWLNWLERHTRDS